MGEPVAENIPAKNLAIRTTWPLRMSPSTVGFIPRLERLIALGYMQSNMLGMRPWTRMACAQMVEDAGDKLQNDGVEAGEAGKIYTSVER